MSQRSIRLAVRAIIIRDARVLLVNAFSANQHSDLWCAPGGGAEAGQSLPDNLKREIYEETGLKVSVGELALVNEFHDPSTGFHQVELFFRCQIVGGSLDSNWVDPDAVVTERRFFHRTELEAIRFKPDSLAEIAFGVSGPTRYDPLEEIVR